MSDLLYYMHDGPATFRFEISGVLAGTEAAKLGQAWRTASSTIAGKTLVVDLTFVKSMDDQGKALLDRWKQAGAHFVAKSDASRALVESVTGVPYAESVDGPTFEPRFFTASMRGLAVASLLLLTLIFPAKASAAQLKQETVDAWNQYLRSADAQLIDRSKAVFLWTDESPERLQRVRAGEIVVAPLGHSPESVPSGLIHRWIGAAFVPGARVDEVIAVIRDYEHYPEVYNASVVDAKALSRREMDDRFSLLVVNTSMFMKRALETEYESKFTQLDARRWYSVAHTTRIQELAGVENRVPVGEPSGYVWKISTLSRYQERDGGVYIETEAMALSRTIPVTMHFLVDPIVRRVSRASLSISLAETRDATASTAASASLHTARHNAFR